MTDEQIRIVRRETALVARTLLNGTAAVLIAYVAKELMVLYAKGLL